MKKLSQWMILCFLAISMSCSDEETLTNDLDVAEQELAVDLSEYVDTSFGMYKGVFTTNDSQQRGIVKIEVINQNVAKAVVNLINGEVFTYVGTPSRNIDGSLTTQFSGNGSSFEFVVAEDGSNPTINRATLNDVPASITTLKENTRGALITNTGLYSGSGFSGTFSIVFDDQAAADGNSTAITTQVMVGGNDIGTTIGNDQTNCSDDGQSQTCDVSGASDADSAISMTWSGTHLSDIGDGVDDCSQFDGTWMATGSGGNSFSGTFTSDSQCGPPENDECENAIVIVCGDNIVASTAAATETGEPTEFCDTSDPNGAGVWYKYTGTADGNLVDIDLSGSNYDTKLWVYSGSCVELTCIAGDDDGGDSTTSRISFLEEDGVDFFIYAAGFSGASGTLNLSVSCTLPPPGDFVSDPLTIMPSPEGTGCETPGTFDIDVSSFSFSNIDDTGCGAFLSSSADIFFTWTSTTDALLFQSNPSNSQDDIVVRDNQGAVIDCAAGSSFGASTLSGWEIGDELIIQIIDGGTGTAQFCLEEATIPGVPENDLCMNAAPIACGESDSGSTLNATDETGTSGNDVFYTFTNDLTIDQDVTVSLCNSSFDTRVRILDGCDGTEIAQNDDNSDACGSAGPSQVTFTAPVGESFIIVVEAFTTQSGNYEIAVSCEDAVTRSQTTKALSGGNIEPELSLERQMELKLEAYEKDKK